LPCHADSGSAIAPRVLVAGASAKRWKTFCGFVQPSASACSSMSRWKLKLNMQSSPANAGAHVFHSRDTDTYISPALMIVCFLAPVPTVTSFLLKRWTAVPWPPSTVVMLVRVRVRVRARVSLT